MKMFIARWMTVVSIGTFVVAFTSRSPIGAQSASDMVPDWNATTLKMSASTTFSPPLESRDMAIVHAAMFGTEPGIHLAATPAIGITKTVLAQGAFPGDGKRIRMDDPLDIHNWMLDFEPYGELGWHMHPGSVVVTVTQGTLTKFETNGCSHVYHAGVTFEELPFKGHNLVEESGAAAETVAVFFIPSGKPVRIDLPAPEPRTCRPDDD